jgi:hypothetical protein
MDSSREHVEEKLLLALQKARDQLLASSAEAQDAKEERSFSDALENYTAALQTFTKFVLYGRIPEQFLD